MKHSRLRYRLGALAAGLGLVIGFVPVASSVTAAGAATPDPVTGITLKVISGAGGSTTAPYASNVHAGDPIATYKWLIKDRKSVV